MRALIIEQDMWMILMIEDACKRESCGLLRHRLPGTMSTPAQMNPARKKALRLSYGPVEIQGCRPALLRPHVDTRHLVTAAPQYRRNGILTPRGQTDSLGVVSAVKFPHTVNVPTVLIEQIEPICWHRTSLQAAKARVEIMVRRSRVP
jgi:hypothetical protein